MYKFSIVEQLHFNCKYRLFGSMQSILDRKFYILYAVLLKISSILLHTIWLLCLLKVSSKYQDRSLHMLSYLLVEREAQKITSV